MAAVTAAIETSRKEGQVVSYPVAASTKIYKGTLVSVDVTTGFLINGRNGTAGDQFVGVAYESVDNSADGTGGALRCRVDKVGDYIFAIASAVQTMVGKAAYISDNATLTLTSTNAQLVGYITELISTTSVRVRIDRGVQ